jgi:transcription elongation GreA/GreB family factor
MGATSDGETRHERRATRRAGPVLAAVDDPDLAVAVARLAAEHARTSGRALVVLAMVPVADRHGLREGERLPGGLQDPAAGAIARLVEPTLEELAVAYRLEIRGYPAGGRPRRQARQIAAAVLRVARQTGAAVVTVGVRRDRGTPGMSVPARVIGKVPAHVRVLLAQPGPPLGAAPARRRAGSGRPAARRPLGGVGAAHAGLATADASPLILTRQGRRLLAERAQRLRAALGDPGHDDRGDTEDGRAAELRRLSWLVEHAADAEDLPDDPEVVELGETVTVQVTGGAPEQFLIVHPVEAPLDTTRISARSPLARALLGRRVGDEVEVDAPGGTYRCRILAAERTP